MAQLVKCLLHKSEDGNLDLSTHMRKKLGRAGHVCDPSAGGRDRQVPWACCPDCLAPSVSLGIKKKDTSSVQTFPPRTSVLFYFLRQGLTMCSGKP